MGHRARRASRCASGKRETIMILFWRRQKELESAIVEYLKETQRCVSSFSRAIDVCFAEGLSNRFAEMVEQTHGFESASDKRRREIENTMYGRAMIPEQRGDILGLLENLDLVANKAESVTYQIWLQNMIVPEQYRHKIKALVQVNVESHELLCEAARYLFTDTSQVLPAVEKVVQKEKESDQIERCLIKFIFDSPGDKVEKILLKELVLEIGAISDLAESVSDRLRIIAIKLPK